MRHVYVGYGQKHGGVVNPAKEADLMPRELNFHSFSGLAAHSSAARGKRARIEVGLSTQRAAVTLDWLPTHPVDQLSNIVFSLRISTAEAVSTKAKNPTMGAQHRRKHTRGQHVACGRCGVQFNRR